jgi:hypothetical protein
MRICGVRGQWKGYFNVAQDDLKFWSAEITAVHHCTQNNMNLYEASLFLPFPRSQKEKTSPSQTLQLRFLLPDILLHHLEVLHSIKFWDTKIIQPNSLPHGNKDGHLHSNLQKDFLTFEASWEWPKK